MITDRQDTNQGRYKHGQDFIKDRDSQRSSTASSRRQRDTQGRDVKHGHKSRPKPKTTNKLPVEMKKAFTHYRYNCLDYYLLSRLNSHILKCK